MGAWERLTECEKARDIAGLSLHQIVDDGSRAMQQSQEEKSQATVVAVSRQKDEIQRAKKTIAQDKAVRIDSAERERDHLAETSRKKSEARKHQGRGIQRLKETHERHKERLDEAEQVREAQFQHNAQRILTLKSSMDTINRQIQSSNETRNKKQQKLKEEQEQRKKDLLNDGANPYEIWRSEDMEADR